MELMICIWESKLIIAGLLLAGYSLFHLSIESQKSDFKSVFLWLMTGKEEYQNNTKPGIILLLKRQMLFTSFLVSLIAINIVPEERKYEFLYLLSAIYVTLALRKIEYNEKAYEAVREFVLFSLGDEKSDEKIAYAKYETYIFGGEIYLLAVGGIIVGTAALRIWDINTLNSIEGFIPTWITIFIAFGAIERAISAFRAKADKAALEET